MKKLFLTTALILGFSASPQVVQAADTYMVDASHTNILLRLDHLGFSDMVLEALEPTGTLMFDAQNPENSSVKIVMKSENIDGDHDGFNAHLKSPDLFHAEKFPEITFESTEVKVTGENTGIITGDLTLLGTTKPVALDVTFNKAGVNPFSNAETIGFTATGSMKRSEWGMGFGLPAIGDEVAIDINFEGVKK